MINLTLLHLLKSNKDTDSDFLYSRYCVFFIYDFAYSAVAFTINAQILRENSIGSSIGKPSIKSAC